MIGQHWFDSFARDRMGISCSSWFNIITIHCASVLYTYGYKPNTTCSSTAELSGKLLNCDNLMLLSAHSLHVLRELRMSSAINLIDSLLTKVSQLKLSNIQPITQTQTQSSKDITTAQPTYQHVLKPVFGSSDDVSWYAHTIHTTTIQSIITTDVLTWSQYVFCNS